MALYEQKWRLFLEEAEANKDSKEIAKAVLYKKDKVLDINSINIPIKEFGKLTKMALKSYILLMQK